MRIGIDFDGTLADIGWAKQQYVRRTWGIELDGADTMRSPAFELLGERRYLEMVEAAHGTELMLDMPAMPGALEVTRRLAEHHDLYLVTARLDEEMELAQRWIAARDLPFSGAVHTRRESKRAAWELHGIDVHLDDWPTVLLDHPDAMVPALLHAKYNAALDRCERTRSVEHWLAFEDLVRTLEEEAGAGSDRTAVRRVQRSR